MNKTKKLASLVLALVMAFALAMPAFATPNDYTDNDPDYKVNDADQLQSSDTPDGTTPSTNTDCSITIDGAQEGHTYNTYQIFSGDLLVTTNDEGETVKTLSNIVWGNGVTEDAKAALGDAAAYAEKLTTAADAEAFAKLLLENDYLQLSATLNYTDGRYSAANLTPGYYLIKDQYTAGPNQDKDDVVSANIMQVLGKEIMKPKAEKPDLDKKITGLDAETEKELEAISAEIGKKVNFELTSKVPEITGYTDKYTFTVHDTMSKGLTFGDDVAVTIGDVAYTDVIVTSSATADGATEITIALDPVKLLKYIKDNDIKTGTEIKVTYSGTVNENALTTDVETNKAKLEYSNNPYDNTSTGETPEETVYVYDFDITILKYDSADETKGTPLADAKFVLKNADGQYYKWDADTKKVTWIDSEEDATLTTNDEGKLAPNAFQGLAAGTYTIHEVAAPDGYNKLAGDYTVTITENFDTEDATKVVSYTISVKDWTNAQVGEDQTITVADHTGNPIGTQLTQNIDVPNGSGALLPETGGIGTTIFYIVGGVLAAGAVILLITKRRMNIDK